MFIKRSVMYSIISSFIGIVSIVVINYSYDVGKLSSTIMTMTSSLTSNSKQVCWSASALILLMWSNKYRPFISSTWKSCGKWRGCWTNSCLVNVAKGFSPLCRSFAILNERKLVVRQVGADDGHGIFYASLICHQHFGVRIGRWIFFGFVHNISKIHICQLYFDFEFVNDTIVRLKYTLEIVK